MLFLIITTISAKAKTKLILTDTTNVVENNVHYKVFSDNNFIYLNISTTDKKTSMSIIRNGLTIYFDIKGKKKKDIYIKYPYNAIPRQLRQNSQEPEINEEFSAIDLNSIIENLPKEAEYVYYDEKQTFHKDLNTQDISLGYIATRELLEFSLKVPKSRISSEIKIDFSKLSIGVLTNKLERSSEKENKQGQDQGMRSGNGNHRGGGMGRGNGQKGGENRGKRQSLETEHTGIDFWFNAKIEEK